MVHALACKRAPVWKIGHRAFTSLNSDTPFTLCFLRHGQSTWNRDNRFIGWTDTPLTDDGVLEARVAGQMLAKSGIRFDEVHTSLLRRSIRTTNLALMELGQEYIPVYKHWRLNERSYGDLVVSVDRRRDVCITRLRSGFSLCSTGQEQERGRRTAWERSGQA